MKTQLSRGYLSTTDQYGSAGMFGMHFTPPKYKMLLVLAKIYLDELDNRCHPGSHISPDGRIYAEYTEHQRTSVQRLSVFEYRCVRSVNRICWQNFTMIAEVRHGIIGSLNQILC